MNLQNALSANNLGIRIFRYLHFNAVCVHIRYTSNMAACYDNDVNDVLHLMYRSVGLSWSFGKRNYANTFKMILTILTELVV